MLIYIYMYLYEKKCFHSLYFLCVYMQELIFFKEIFIDIGSFNVSVFFFSHELNIYFYDTFSSWNIQSCTIGNPVWSQVNYFSFFFLCK